MKRMCSEGGRVGYHHPNCPEADDWEDPAKKMDKASLRQTRKAKQQAAVDQFRQDHLDRLNERIRWLRSRGR